MKNKERTIQLVTDKVVHGIYISALPLVGPYYLYKKIKSKLNFADEESYIVCRRIETWYKENFKNHNK